MFISPSLLLLHLLLVMMMAEGSETFFIGRCVGIKELTNSHGAFTFPFAATDHNFPTSTALLIKSGEAVEYMDVRRAIMPVAIDATNRHRRQLFIDLGDKFLAEMVGHLMRNNSCTTLAEVTREHVQSYFHNVFLPALRITISSGGGWFIVGESTKDLWERQVFYLLVRNFLGVSDGSGGKLAMANPSQLHFLIRPIEGNDDFLPEWKPILTLFQAEARGDGNGFHVHTVMASPNNAMVGVGGEGQIENLPVPPLAAGLRRIAIEEGAAAAATHILLIPGPTTQEGIAEAQAMGMAGVIFGVEKLEP